MSTPVKVPPVGESIQSGVLGTWRKKQDEFVRTGDVLFEIETDKVTSEVYADTDGILHQLVPEGAEVQIGQVVAEILPGNPDNAPSPASTQAPSSTETSVTDPDASTPSPTSSKASEKAATELKLSPAVRRLVEEHQLNPANITGTGKDGRLLKEDVLKHLEQKPAVISAPPTTPANQGSRITRKRMSPLRQKIAARLVSAQHEAAMLTTFNEVDMSAVIALRKQFQERFVARHEIKLGFMSFFVQAAVHALRQVPEVNAHIEDSDIVQHHFYDIGVAISTDRGLLVPVIRDADQLSLAELEKSIAAFAQKARSGKITLPDLEGGVFTITNGGIFGSLLSTPIINPPQSAILGMHAIQERPVAVAGRVEIRPMMYLALTYDHRLVDGKQAVTFLVRIKEFIENPAAALLQL